MIVVIRMIAMMNLILKSFIEMAWDLMILIMIAMRNLIPKRFHGDGGGFADIGFDMVYYMHGLNNKKSEAGFHVHIYQCL